MNNIFEHVEINCILCKSKNITNISLNFIQYNDCDCIFNQNFNDEKKSLLDIKPIDTNSVFSKLSNPIKMRFWDLISKQYIQYLEEKTSLKFKTAFDIGALYGHLVKRLNEHGINTKGIEVDYSYISNTVYGNMCCGYFDENFQSDEKYDLVCLTQMIYYVKNPILTIKKAYELLNDSGVIFISTQNPTSSIIKQKQYSIFENSMNILLSEKNFHTIVSNLNLKLIDFTNYKPNIYLDRLNKTSITSEFKNYLKYHKKSAYEKNLDGHHSFVLLQKI